MNVLGLMAFICMLRSWDRFFGIIVLMWFGWQLVRAFKNAKLMN